MAAITRSRDLDLFGEYPETYGIGYADAPGSGPAGKICRSCVHLMRSGRERLFSKCCAGTVTRGAATDISMWSPACRKFEQRDPGVPIHQVRRA